MLRLDITQGNPQPMPIALPDFVAGSPNEAETARNVTAIITNNLKRSGLFAPIDPAAFTEKITNSDAVPRFADWRVINAQALATGRITKQPDGRLKAEFRLWDVFAGQQLDGKQYFTTPDNWRRIAHIISDAIYSTADRREGLFRQPHRVRRRDRSGERIASSASPSWTRTAPACAISRAATIWC